MSAFTAHLGRKTVQSIANRPVGFKGTGPRAVKASIHAKGCRRTPFSAIRYDVGRQTSAQRDNFLQTRPNRLCKV